MALTFDLAKKTSEGTVGEHLRILCGDMHPVSLGRLMVRCVPSPKSGCFLLFIGFFAFTFFCSVAYGEKSIARRELPVELQASDPEIENLLDSATDKSDLGDMEGAEWIAKKAWDLCNTNHIESDLPIVDLQLASLSISKGEIDTARDLLNKAFDLAADRENVVLESDILISLAILKEISGDRKGAFETNNRALEKAKLGKSPYMQSRALGDTARMWISAGSIKEARACLSEALDIDRANHYSLEALHRVYWAILLGMESDKNTSTAIQDLQEAIRLAETTGSTYAAFLGKTTLGAVLIYRGDVNRGLELLNDQPSTRSLVLDFNRIEALAIAYEGAHLADKSAETWQILLDNAKKVNNPYFIAEAAQRLGNINRDRKQPEAAFEYYETAARNFRTVGNKTGLLQVLTSEIPLLQAAKQDEKAPQIYAETLTLVQEQKSIQSDNLQFALYLGWSMFYKQQKDWNKEIDNLEKAERLIPVSSTDHPWGDSLSRALMGMWVDHAAAAESLQLPYVSILALEQAFQCALQLKDEKAEGTIMSIIVSSSEQVGAYKDLRKECDSGKLEECLASALSLNTLELLNQPWRDKWKAEQGLTITKLTALPEQLAVSSEGVSFLTRILNLISPIESNIGIPIDLVLAKYYLFSSNESSSARRMLEDADQLLVKAHIESNPTAEASLKQGRLTTHCWLSLALARTGEPESAEKILETCLQEATSIGTREAMNFAEAASASVRLLINNPAATEATQYWVKVFGDSPDMHRAYSYSLGQAKDFEGAIREMDVAAKMYEQSGRQSDLAQAEISLALCHQMQKTPDFPSALVELRKALVLFQNLHDEKGQAQAYLDLGFVFLAEKQTKKARESFEAARQLAHNTSEWQLEGRSLWALGDLAKTNENDAESLYEQAEKLFSRAGLFDAESEVLVQDANIVRAGGNTDEAIRLLLHARDLAEQSQNVTALIGAYTSLGIAYESAGQYQNALLAFSGERDKAASEKNILSQAYAELAISGIYQMLGEWSSAFQNATSALHDFKSLNDEKGELFSYSLLIAIYTERNSEMKDFKKAQSLYNEASQLKTFPSESGLINTHLLEMYLQTGQYKEGFEIANSIISECKAMKNDSCIANAHLSLAEIYSAKGEFGAAQGELDTADPLVQTAQDYYSMGRLLYVKARLEQNEGKYDAAVKDYSSVIQMIGDQGASSDSNTSQAVSENYAFIFDELVKTLFLKSKVHTDTTAVDAASALRYVELDKSQEFDKAWGAKFVEAMRRALPTDLREKESEIQTRNNRLQSELRSILSGSDNQNRSADKIRADLLQANRDLNLLIPTLREKYPAYAAIRYPLPLEIEALPLVPGELLLEFRVTEDATYVWMIEKTNGHPQVSQFYLVAKGREWIRHQVGIIKEGISLTQLGGYNPRTVEELTTVLFPDSVYDRLRTAKSIVYIPDDALGLVPLEVFSPNASRGMYPLAEVATTYYPSSEAMIIARNVSRAGNWPKELLATGDPITSDTDPRWEAAELSAEKPDAAAETPSKVENKLRSAGISFARLPGTSTEVLKIAELVEHNGGKADVRLGIEATRKKLLETDLRNYTFIHFATHGLLPVDSDLREPALLFSFTGNSDDMLLGLSRILDLQLRSDMVVLSACNTGSGKLSKSEGVYNLGRAFLASGASSAIVSMWEVADNSTAMFMQELYKSVLKGEPKNVALMHARMALIRQPGYEQPFYWAPFILIGQ